MLMFCCQICSWTRNLGHRLHTHTLRFPLLPLSPPHPFWTPSTPSLSPLSPCTAVLGTTPSPNESQCQSSATRHLWVWSGMAYSPRASSGLRRERGKGKLGGEKGKGRGKGKGEGKHRRMRGLCDVLILVCASCALSLSLPL